MKKIFVVGGNGFARECCNYILEISKHDPEIVFAGFLGHGGYGHTVDYKNFQPYYRGEMSDHEFQDDEYAVIGAGYPELRSKIYHDLKAKNAKFYTLIESGSKLNEFVEIGEANIFVATRVISPNIKIGNANLFNGRVHIGHDVEVGDCNFFGACTHLLGNVKVGNNNQVGVNSVFLPHCKIGNNNKIAPLSAVYRGCRDNSYIAGNPALKIGNTDQKI